MGKTKTPQQEPTYHDFFSSVVLGDLAVEPAVAPDVADDVVAVVAGVLSVPWLEPPELQKLIYQVEISCWSGASQLEQTLPDVLRPATRVDWQKHETQVDESAAAVQLSCAPYRVEHERPHSGNEGDAAVGIRFLLAASEVGRSDSRSKADQRPVKSGIAGARERNKECV